MSVVIVVLKAFADQLLSKQEQQKVEESPAA